MACRAPASASTTPTPVAPAAAASPSAERPAIAVQFLLDGAPCTVEDDDQSLLSALREELGVRSPKDGCSPQGQCGCCTVLVDGAPRVSCVTSVRRVAGRSVTTADGLAAEVREPLVSAIVEHGGSQCGFCTPGIVCRLAALGPAPGRVQVERALLAHLCRCTGWRGLVDAADAWSPGAATTPPRRPGAVQRAALEGGTPQRPGQAAALGRAGFADDTAPRGALVAVPAAGGGWSVAATLAAARAASGRPQGRRSGQPLRWPLDVAPGEWAVQLQTTWVEPAYLEPDASWCRPGGEPATPVANGGAFGGKLGDPRAAAAQVAEAARTLADLHGRPVRVVYAREDVVRLGPKRPPLAIGLRADGSGLVRVARTPGVAEAITAAFPEIDVEEVDVAGPPTSSTIRGAGWAEVAAARAVLVPLGNLDEPRGGDGSPSGDGGGPPLSPGGGSPAGHGTATVRSPDGAEATASVDVDDAGCPTAVAVHLTCGPVLDTVILRSYATGAAHMALGWVCSEGLALDDDGVPVDLTMRSFGVLRAVDTPPIDVRLTDGPGPAVNGSDAVFAAVAAATWLAVGLPPRWPVRRASP